MLPLILCIVFMALGAIALTLFLIEKIRKYSVKATMIKSVCSLFFIAVSAVGLYKNGTHVLPLYVTLALILGLLGDIWLDFKYVFKEHDKPFTYAGFVMFGLGHILFVTGMFHEYYHGEHFLYILLPLVGGLIMGALTILLEKPMKLNYGDMKAIGAIYAVCLFSTACTALSLCIMTQFKVTTLIMMLGGGVLFAVSDLILSGTYFGEGKERPVDIVTNTVSYYMAQFTIAFAMFFIA